MFLQLLYQVLVSSLVTPGWKIMFGFCYDCFCLRQAKREWKYLWFLIYWTFEFLNNYQSIISIHCNHHHQTPTPLPTQQTPTPTSPPVRRVTNPNRQFNRTVGILQGSGQPSSPTYLKSIFRLRSWSKNKTRSLSYPPHHRQKS